MERSISIRSMTVIRGPSLRLTNIAIAAAAAAENVARGQREDDARRRRREDAAAIRGEDGLQLADS